MSATIVCPVCPAAYLRADAAEDEYEAEPLCDHWLGRRGSDDGFTHGLEMLEDVDLRQPELGSVGPTDDAIEDAFGEHAAMARRLFGDGFGEEKVGHDVLEALAEPLGLQTVTVEYSGSMLGWCCDDHFVLDPPAARRALTAGIEAFSQGLARLAASENADGDPR